MNSELREAKKTLADLAGVERWGSKEHKAYRKAEAVFVENGKCPSCYLDDGHISLLGDWQPGNWEEHAGRACLECEEFFKCGEQPEYEPDPWMGDADPGL